jgi:hypothetical protein
MKFKVKTKSGRVLVIPTAQEDAVITRVAMSDRDAKPLTDAQWDAVKPELLRERPPEARCQPPKLSERLAATPGELNRVAGWDEMPAIGAEL